MGNKPKNDPVAVETPQPIRQPVTQTVDEAVKPMKELECKILDANGKAIKGSDGKPLKESRTRIDLDHPDCPPTAADDIAMRYETHTRKELRRWKKESPELRKARYQSSKRARRRVNECLNWFSQADDFMLCLPKLGGEGWYLLTRVGLPVVVVILTGGRIRIR